MSVFRKRERADKTAMYSAEPHALEPLTPLTPETRNLTPRGDKPHSRFGTILPRRRILPFEWNGVKIGGGKCIRGKVAGWHRLPH